MTESRIYIGDCRKVLQGLDSESVNCIVTSPPYWNLRAYDGNEGMIGREETWEQHSDTIMEVMAECWRVLRKDGTLWFNYGDAYPGGRGQGDRLSNTCKQHTNRASQVGATFPPGFAKKSLMLMPTRLLVRFVDEQGWLARSKIIWHKPSPMPESVKDRPTNAYEEIFLLTKRARYWYDADAVKEKAKSLHPPGEPSGWIHEAGNSSKFPEEHMRERHVKPGGWAGTRNYHGNDPREPRVYRDRDVQKYTPNRRVNVRNVWTISSVGYKGKHFATFPPELAKRCILAGCPEGGTVMDPFGGTGTVGMVAAGCFRNSITIEISEKYAAMSLARIEDVNPLENRVEMFEIAD